MRRQPDLKIGQVMAAQRDIVGEVQRPGRRPSPPPGPHSGSQLGAFLIDVFAQRLHFREQGAQFF